VVVKMVVNKAKNHGKTRPISVLHSTELASFFNGLGDAARSAKPLCVGSIPTRASKISLIMSIKPADLACLGTPSQVCLFSEYSCLFCNFRPVLGRGSDQNRTEIRLISFLKNESYVPNKLVSNPKWQPESEVVATGFFRGNESGYSENRRDRAMGWK
jgi:hypothetical protein